MRPLYQTGIPAAALARVIDGAGLPLPQSRVDMAHPASELAAARAIVDAYNRSNGMNMIALTALVVMPDAAALDDTQAPSPAPWPVLRPLLAADDIDADTWALLQDINRFGGGTGALATLWRHLAHWPGLLAAIKAGFAPLQQSGALLESMQRVHDLGRDEAAGLATLRPDPVVLPDEARQMISGYVASPTGVGRMVTLGHILGRWLDSTARC